MRQRMLRGVVGVLGVGLVLLLGRAGAQDGAGSPDGAWDHVALRKAITDIGYEPKPLNAEAGKEKYEFVLVKGDLNIPIAAEISPSKNYLWLTVRLNDAPTDYAAAGAKFGGLLKANAKIQPCQFYITDSGKLMIALPIDNRGMSNPVLRRRVDFLTDAVVQQKGVWQS